MKDFLVPALVSLACLTAAPAVRAADFPAPAEGDFVARDFRFGSGETLPALSLTTGRSARRSATPPGWCGTR